jgi:hypothetical protein
MGRKERAEVEMVRVVREAEVYRVAREYMRRQVEVMRMHGCQAPAEGSLLFETAVTQVAEQTLKLVKYFKASAGGEA